MSKDSIRILISEKLWSHLENFCLFIFCCHVCISLPTTFLKSSVKFIHSLFPFYLFIQLLYHLSFSFLSEPKNSSSFWFANLFCFLLNFLLFNISLPVMALRVKISLMPFLVMIKGLHQRLIFPIFSNEIGTK